MDAIRIGQFLKELRKENNMTQEQLGERIGVTNKTISKWETGNYMPPVDCLKSLSDIYQISINEILAGERLKQENYKEAAEDNIKYTLKKAETESKTFENKMLIIMGISTILAIAIILLLPDAGSLPVEEKVKEIIICVLVVLMVLLSNTLNLIAVLLNKNSYK